MYVKLFSSILTSSVWDQDHRVIRLWITLLALSDRKGFVFASPGGLAAQARLSREEMEVALKVLTSPDPDDSSGENDGRRVEKIQGGWQITTYERYRHLVDEDVRRDQTKLRVRKHRNKARSVTLGNAPKRSVAVGDAQKRHSESDAESDADTEKKKKGGPGLVFPPELDTQEFAAAWQRWDKYRRERGNKLTPSTVESQIKALAKVGAVEAIGRIERSIENGWTGLFPTDARPVGRFGEPNAEKQARVKAGWDETRAQIKKGPDA